MGVDWDRMAAVARRHRVEGLVHDGLRRAGIAPPPEVAGPIATEAAAIARQNLGFASEAHRLTGHEAFQRVGARPGSGWSGDLFP